MLDCSCGCRCEILYPSSREQQFRILAEKILRDPSLADNPKFATNDARVKNRTEVVRIITDALMQNDREYWLEQFKGLGCVLEIILIVLLVLITCCRVPFGPINNIEQTFQHHQVRTRAQL